MSKFWNIENKGNGKGELKLYGEIVSEKPWTPWIDADCTSYRDFISELETFSDCSLIDVHISSGGGDVLAANTIYSRLRQLKEKNKTINVIIEGICASAATIVAMAGDRIIAERNSIIMIHNPAIGLSGIYNEKDLSKGQNILETLKKSIISAYMSKLNKTEEELSKIMDEGEWFTGEEAMELGLVDEVFDSGKPFFNFVNSKYAVADNFVFSIGEFKNFPTDKIKTACSKVYIKNSIKEEKLMTVNEIKEKYPGIYDEIEKSAAAAERERIKAIDEISGNIPRDFVMKAKYKDCVSAEKMAYDFLKADNKKARDAFENIAADNAESGVKSVGFDDIRKTEIKKTSGLINLLKGADS